MEPHEPSYAATVAYRLATVLLVLWVVFAVSLAVVAIAGSRDTVVFEASATLNEDLLPEGVYATSEQRTGIAIEDPTPREQRLAFAIDVLPMMLWFAVLWLLRGVVRSVRDGDPFTQPNVRRLRAIALLLVVGVVAVHYGATALQDQLLESFSRPASDLDARGLRPADADFPDLALVCGLGVFVLAQVFAYGTRLREDVAATI